MNENDGSIGVFALHRGSPFGVASGQVLQVKDIFGLDVSVDPFSCPTKQSVTRTFAMLLGQVEDRRTKAMILIPMKLYDITKTPYSTYCWGLRSVLHSHCGSLKLLHG